MCERLDAPELHAANLSGQGPEWILLLRLCGEGQRPHCAPMKAVVGDHHLLSAGQSCDLEGSLIRLGPGVAEEDLRSLRRL